MSWNDVFKLLEGGPGSGPHKGVGGKTPEFKSNIPKSSAELKMPVADHFGGHARDIQPDPMSGTIQVKLVGPKESAWLGVFNLKESTSPDGFNTPFWKMEAAPTPPDVPVVSEAPQTVDQAVTRIILDNPGISAATLVNTLKQQGFEIVKADIEQPKEADSSSSQGAAILAAPPQPKKESSTPQVVVPSKLANRKTHKISEANFKIKETTINDGIGPTKFKVQLIEEGLGNLKDAFYYTKEAIQSGVVLFEGKKMYADHPDAIGEQTRPERSIRDIVGNFEALMVEEGKDGRACLVGCATMIADSSYSWARSLMRQAVALGPRFPDKQFIGLSINASGEAEEMPWEDFFKVVQVPASAMPKIKSAMEAGVPMVRVVRVLKDAISCDLVTEPGAGGKPLQIIENNKMPSKEANIMIEKKEEAKEALPTTEGEAKKTEGSEATKEAAPDDSSDDKAAPADDADGDKDVMMDMLKKHGALAEAMDPAAVAMAKEAFEAYKSMGYEEGDAYKCAANALKLAKHMQGKAAGGTPPPVAPPAQESTAPSTAEDTKDPSQLKAAAQEAVETTESTKKVLTLQGQLAKANEKISAFECAVHLEKILKESGLSNKSTKSFRESAIPLKTVDSINKAFEVWIKGFKEAQSGMGNGFFGSPEKTEDGGMPSSAPSFLRD